MAVTMEEQDMTHHRSIITRTTGLALAIALISSQAAGCVQEEPPELPPVTSLTANLSAPESAPLEAKNADPAGAGDYSNFANAWVRVKILQLYGAGIVLIPGVVMAAALNQEPRQEVRADSEAWIWSVSALGATADLEIATGLVSGWDVDLLVSNAELDRYLWIEGNFALDLSEGVWTAHDANLPADADSALEIRWTHVSDTDRTLVFENTNQSSPDVGDRLTFSVSGTTATLRFEDASDPGVVANISWDTDTAAGSIEVPLHNNGEKACWNAAFVNAPCE